LNDVAGDKVPPQAVVRRLRAFFGVPGRPLSQRTCVDFATFAKKCTLLSHHSVPQQIGQRPFLCIGLHLSLVSPQILALSGAMWLLCFPRTPEEAPAACFSKHWRTNRLKFGIRSAIRAVSSSRLMVLFLAMFLRTPRKYMYLLILMTPTSLSAPHAERG